ncbi:MAG: hypothetical protein HWN66_13860 [Candidatus Helarchaeota archaeon]|nr:hypothetical protein [Candidatus Helarchaeota archaeon]
MFKNDKGIPKFLIGKKISIFKSDNEKQNVICDLIIEIWRLKNKIKRIKSKLEKDDEKLIMEQVERIEDVLERHGFEIIDYAGENYNNGMADIRVLAFEDNPNNPKGYMRIKDVIKPVIYYKNKPISKGEVIVEKGLNKQKEGQNE